MGRISGISLEDKGSQGEGTIPTKPRSRSVPDVMDTKFAASYKAAY